MGDHYNRRAFLRAAAAAGVAWAAADLVQIEDALAYAGQQAAAAGAAPSTLTPARFAAVEAMASRILPAVDGRAGAREAGAAYFIDRALGTFNSGQRGAYEAGLADLDSRAKGLVPAASGFAALTASQQDDVLRAVETTPFFQMARFDVLVGTFALPSWGGNRDYAGWHMIGFEHQPRFQAPFGYYDAEINRRA
jgi:hypothetical protein